MHPLVICVSVGDNEIVVNTYYAFRANAETVASNLYPVFGVLGLVEGMEGLKES